MICVSPDRTGGAHEPLIQAHRDLIAENPSQRVLVVGGAGSLEVGGVLLKDTPDFPALYFNEASTFTTILDLYRASRGIQWTMLSPPPIIKLSNRTGVYLVGNDSPVGSSISAEDFAVALVEELENPSHAFSRFTVAHS